VSELPCPHCGQPHPPEETTCPATGRPLIGASPAPEAAAPPAAAPPPPAPGSTAEAASAAAPAAAAPAADAAAPEEKGVADILKEAYDMYRRQARDFLTTCALLFVPGSIVKSCALSLILGPTVAAGAAGSGMGSFALEVLGALGMLVTGFCLYGVIVPLTGGALTMMVADRILGGQAGWRQAWALLYRRLGVLLSAVLPAAGLIALGAVLTRIPVVGVVAQIAVMAMGLAFAFVSPVALLEGTRGRAALRRSAELVLSDWLRVAIMIIALAVLLWVAQMLAHLLLPVSAPFFRSLFGDLFTMVLLPIPVLGVVLLYFDIRRRREGFTQDGLREGLDALRGA
jgi:hypothetical protein